MKTNKKSTTRNHKKQNKQDQNSSKTMKFFYVLMFLLIASSSVIRVAGASRHPQYIATPTPKANPTSGGGTAVSVFHFHRDDSSAGMCTDLTIPVTGSVVYSNCGAGLETQYDLSDAESAQLQSWLAQFQPVNNENTAGNVSIQLYLNGRGNQMAFNADIQSMVQFAETLAAKIASQP